MVFSGAMFGENAVQQTLRAARQTDFEKWIVRFEGVGELPLAVHRSYQTTVRSFRLAHQMRLGGKVD